MLGAASRCVAHFGVSKTTLEDVSREAGLSRATLYRLFPGGRDQILASMVSKELQEALSRIAARLDRVDDLEERIVVAMTAGAGELVAHEALGFVLEHEPERVIPHASFAQLDLLLETASSFLAPYLADCLDPEDARRVGEWVTRLVLSHVACGRALGSAEPGSDAAGAVPGPPPRPFALHLQPLPEERARWLVRTFVMPGLASLRARPSRTTSHSSSRPPEVAGPT